MTPAFEISIRTRGYEVDATCTVPLPVFLSYLEYLRWEWIQVPSFGLNSYLNQGHFFVVQSQVCEVLLTVGMGVDLVLRGVPERVGRSRVRVRHEIVRKSDGALVAHALVFGVWLGPDRRLKRLPDEARTYASQFAPYLPTPVSTTDHDPSAEGTGGPSFIAPTVVRRATRGLDIEPPSALTDGYSMNLVPRPSDMDVFGHVNAATYPRWMLDAWIHAAARGELPPPHPIARAALSYDREALVGDALTVRVARRGDGGGVDGMVLRGDTILCRGRID